MSWNEKLICRILLLIAGMATKDNELSKELKSLISHIQYGDPSERKAALMGNRITAAILVAFAVILGSPFAVIGFVFQFATASFETGRATATLLSRWMDKQ